MAFDKNKVTSIHQVHGGVMGASGLWSLNYTGVIADLTTASAAFKSYLDSLNIVEYDWIMAKLSDSANMGIVTVTNDTAELSLLAFAV